MAGRILGMGDIVSLVETGPAGVRPGADGSPRKRRLQKGEFTLDDFRKQMAQIAKPGLMQKMMGMMPGMGEMTRR